jgi:hypothetical protein
LSVRLRVFPPMAALAAAAMGLWSCLMDQPLARPGDAYDARSDLRGDSLTRFDTVEVWLQDAEDPGSRILLFKGPLASPESLGVRLGEGPDQVYVIYGYKRGKAGACFEARHPRESGLTLLKDSCEAPEPVPPAVPPPEQPPKEKDPKDPDTKDPQATDPDGPAPENPTRTLPRFALHTLELEDSLPARAIVRDMGAAAAEIRTSAPWLQAEWEGGGRADTAGGILDAALGIRALTGNLEAGLHSGMLILETGGQARDTLMVNLTVSQRFARGSVTDWISGAPQRGIRVDLETGSYAITGADGRYAIPVPAGLPRAAARFTDAGRIGALDTVPVSTDTGTAGRETRIPTAAAFKAVDLSGERPIGAVAAAAGYGIALSTPFDQAGQVDLIRLDAPLPLYQKSIPLGNADGDPDFPEYFEAGDLAADSDALYIAYPEANRIERVGGWRGAPERLIVSAPLRPGGLLLDGPRLLTLGRLEDGTLALARFRASDLAFLGMDTLPGYGWDAVQPLRRTPRLIAAMGSYYAVDGNGPGAPGHLLRLDKESGKVTAARDIPEGSAVDLIRIGERIYVGSAAPAARRIRGFDPDLAPVDTLDPGAPVERLAGDPSGALGPYGFALAGGSMLAFVPRGQGPIGALALPTALAPRWLAVDGPTRTVLVSDGKRVFTAAFRPE